MSTSYMGVDGMLTRPSVAEAKLQSENQRCSSITRAIARNLLARFKRLKLVTFYGNFIFKSSYNCL